MSERTITSDFAASVPMTARGNGSTMIRLLGPAIATLAIVVASSLLGTYPQYIATLVVGSIVTGVGLTILVGFARCISLATGAMLALGAYGSAILVVRLDWHLVPALGASIVFGALAGIILGIPGVRFRGHNLAMITLVFQAVVIIVLREWTNLTGGAEGLRVPEPSLGGISLADDYHYLVFCGICAALILTVASLFIYGRPGRNLKALARNEVAAEAFGISINAHLIAAFSVSSAIIAFSGALQAPRYRIIDPDSFGILVSVTMLAYPIVGGLSSIWGGVIGGASMRLLPEFLRGAADYQELIYCGIVLVVVLFFPQGLVGTLRNALRSYQRRARPADNPKRPNPVNHGLAIRRQAPTDVALEIHDLSKSYGALRAVDDVNAVVATGEIHGLMGPNGAGKTTLFNMLSGFIRPDSGSIRCFGLDLSASRTTDRITFGITRTFQHVATFSNLSVFQNVAIGLGGNRIRDVLLSGMLDALHRKQDAPSRARIMGALGAVGLDKLADEDAGSLSLGSQRRLEIARAIVSQPRVILLDEPVSGLSEDEAAAIAELLTGINRQHGITMVIVEHNIRFLTQVADTITVLASGRKIITGTPDVVLANDAVRRVYFGEAA